MTLGTFISIVFLCVLIAEFWLGIAVTGIHGDDMYVEREKHPRKYWLAMALQVGVTVGLPLLKILAG